MAVTREPENRLHRDGLLGNGTLGQPTRPNFVLKAEKKSSSLIPFRSVATRMTQIQSPYESTTPRKCSTMLCRDIRVIDPTKRSKFPQVHPIFRAVVVAFDQRPLRTELRCFNPFLRQIINRKIYYMGRDVVIKKYHCCWGNP